MSIKWPPLILKEYEHWNRVNDEKERCCLNAGFLNEVLRLKGDARLIKDRPPCFFVGRIGESKIMLLSLNPGFRGKRKEVEYSIFKERGWERTYLDFFKWFVENNLSSPYYSRFAVFLSGYLGYDSYPTDKRQRFELLDKNLVNVDLIPYHSKSFTNRVLEMRSKAKTLLDDYIGNLRALMTIARPDVVFMNGAIFEELLTLFGVTESTKPFGFEVNEKYGRKLIAYSGTISVDGLKIKTIRFKNFLTGQALAATNEGLFQAGRSMSKWLRKMPKSPRWA